MIIYKIYAIKLNGSTEVISPIGINKDKDEMLKIAKRMKYEMQEYYKQVDLKAFEYDLVSNYFIEV